MICKLESVSLSQIVSISFFHPIPKVHFSNRHFAPLLPSVLEAAVPCPYPFWSLWCFLNSLQSCWERKHLRIRKFILSFFYFLDNEASLLRGHFLILASWNTDRWEPQSEECKSSVLSLDPGRLLRDALVYFRGKATLSTQALRDSPRVFSCVHLLGSCPFCKPSVMLGW